MFDENERYDIYSVMLGSLGPYADLLHRKAVMCEVLRVQAAFESDWKWNEGVDINNQHSLRHLDGQETGAFQVSADSMRFDESLSECVDRLAGNHEVLTFINAMKSNHALAVEYCARLLEVQHQMVRDDQQSAHGYRPCATRRGCGVPDLFAAESELRVPQRHFHQPRRKPHRRWRKPTKVVSRRSSNSPQMFPPWMMRNCGPVGSSWPMMGEVFSARRLCRRPVDFAARWWDQRAGYLSSDHAWKGVARQTKLANHSRRSTSGGDSGSTRGDQPDHGRDHIYVVLKKVDDDEMLIADNQQSQPHSRFVSGQGRTPTKFFLRAT